MSKTGVIISGGSINDAFTLDMLRKIEPEYIIGVDSGLSFLYRNRVMPTHIVGDFDSVEPKVIAYYREETKVPIREFNPVKDATDTEIALRMAIELGVQKLWIFGATGTRLDHVLSNIHILKIPHDEGVEAYLVDECNRISLWGNQICIRKAEKFGKYLSIFPFSGPVENVSIVGAKYPLANYRVSADESRCVSNEVVDDEVLITFSDGLLILMETRDKE